MSGTFPFYRPRRLRQTDELRAMVRESHLRKEQLVLPLFVTEGTQKRVPVPSMPGVFQLSIDELLAETRSAWETGVRAILLFGIPDHKDEKGSSAYDPEGITQRAVRALRKEFPDLIIITDVCLCEYTSHGHCGMIRKTPWGRTFVDNDSTLEILAQTALSHVMAGADIVAPSDMMDGRIGAIRKTLDDAGFTDAVIMSYAAKYASAFYGPFRDAADSAPKFGDRRAYQMDPANAEEALREVAMDIEEGADIVMVKPGLAYLDILNRVKNTFHYPTAVYMVSGEYAMIKAAGEKGWIDEDRIMMESHLSMVRAGADIIITYAAPSICKMLNNKK
ncbi:MAG: porphobilinogen synthase [Verrucomicrobia bacterium]|nr:porphobilinogen synthase [Verrucomicrobiota bacterium]MBR6464109.1 porphobilinogen synthase [Verrucomicrobiota bacterium]